jgi:hypothetical protein
MAQTADWWVWSLDKAFLFYSVQNAWNCSTHCPISKWGSHWPLNMQPQVNSKPGHVGSSHGQGGTGTDFPPHVVTSSILNDYIPMCVLNHENYFSYTNNPMTQHRTIKQWVILCMDIVVLQRETRFRSHNKTKCEETMLNAIYKCSAVFSVFSASHWLLNKVVLMPPCNTGTLFYLTICITSHSDNFAWQQAAQH